MAANLRFSAALFFVATATSANAAIIDVTGATLVAAFKTVNAGDTLRVTGDVASIALWNRSFTKTVTIDATAARFTDSLSIYNVNNLKVVGGVFGSTTTPLRTGRAVGVWDSANITFSKNTFVGPGVSGGATAGHGLTFSGVTRGSIISGTFSGLRLGIGVTSSSNVSLTSNRFTAMTSDGINIVDSHFVKANLNTCSAFAMFAGAHPDCIQLWSIAGNPVQSDVALLNNIVKGPTQGLTAFDNPAAGGTLRLSVIGNTVATSYPQGIACYNCVDGIFTNNVLTTLAGSAYRTSLNIIGGSNNTIASNSVGVKPLLIGAIQARDENGNPVDQSDPTIGSFDDPVPDFALEYLASHDTGFDPGAIDPVDPVDPIALEGFSFAATASVPEPLVWVQMLFGFGLTGGMLRRLNALRGVSA